MSDKDTIYRQAAIDVADAVWSVTGDKNVAKVWDQIKDLPSAQPEQRWISVSERLPEPRIDVWCNSDMGQMVGYYEENVETWYGRDYLELMVTAWMPLPEPYKGGEQDG